MQLRCDKTRENYFINSKCALCEVLQITTKHILIGCYLSLDQARDMTYTIEQINGKF